MNPSVKTGRGRTQFLLLATLFFLPLVASWLLYFYLPDFRPAGTVNYGTLVSPVKPLPQWSWQDADGKPVDSRAMLGKWTLVQRIEGSCDEACAERVLLTRQTHTALHAERDRVQRLLLLSDAALLPALRERLATAHPDLLWRVETVPGEAAAFFGSADPLAVYLIDPLGNYLMVYPAGRGTHQDFRGMQKDIKKLLKLSQIG